MPSEARLLYVERLAKSVRAHVTFVPQVSHRNNPTKQTGGA